MSNSVPPESQSGVPADSVPTSPAQYGAPPEASSQVPQSGYGAAQAPQAAQVPPTSQQAYGVPQQAAPAAAQPGFQQQAQAQFQNLLAKPSPHFPANVRNVLGGLSAASVLVTLLALFTPFASVSMWGFSESVALFESRDGILFWVLLVGTIAATVLIFLQDKVAKGVMWVIPGVAIVGALLSLIELFGNNEAFDYGASRGFGYFMVLVDLILFIAIAVYSIMSLIKKDATGPVPTYPAHGTPQQPGYGQPQAYHAPPQQAPQAFQPQQPGYGQPQAPQQQAPQRQVPQAYQPQRPTDPQQPTDGQPQA